MDLYSSFPGVVRADVRRSLPFVDHSFDAVYQSHVLEHISRHEAKRLLSECCRILRDDGIIRVVVPDLEQIAKTYVEWLDKVTREGGREAEDRYNWIVLELLDQLVREQSGGEMMEYFNRSDPSVMDFIVERCGKEYLGYLERIVSRPKSCFEERGGEELSAADSIDPPLSAEKIQPGEKHFWMYDRYSLSMMLQDAGFNDVRVCMADESRIPNFNSYRLDVLGDGSIRKPDSLFIEGRKGSRSETVERLSTVADERGFEDDRDTHDQQVSKLRENAFRLLTTELSERSSEVASLKIRLDQSNVEKRRMLDERLAEIANLRKSYECVLDRLPLVSVVTPVYNGAKYLERCIKSVLDQDYPKIEHIVIDGGSTDGSVEICRKYPQVTVFSKADLGESHAINRGFSMAQGDVLAWLCADDEYEPLAVSSAIREIMMGRKVVMGLSRFIDEEGRVICEHPSNVYPFYDHDMFLRFWKYNPISQPAVFWTRRMWERCGPLRMDLCFAMDYDLWLRMSRLSMFQRVDTHMAKYRLHQEAKCIADNYGSKVELIRVSRKYWPSSLTFMHWKLVFSYLFTTSPITEHFSECEALLSKAEKYIREGKRRRAVAFFVKAHWVHPAAPWMKGYWEILKLVVLRCSGLGACSRIGRKTLSFMRRKQR